MDLFGVSHDESTDALGWEVLDHLEARHALRPAHVTEAAAYFTPDGQTSRVVRRSVRVQR